MSLDEEIQYWLKSEELAFFYQKAEYTMVLVVESQGSESLEFLHPHLVEMGRRYNHFLFTVTENLIKKARERTSLSVEEISLATQQFIAKLEEAILVENPPVFAFFLKYRESIQHTVEHS